MPVGANFHDLRDRVVAEIDKAFSERLRHLPMRDAEPDDGRQVVEFSAVLRVGGGTESKLGGRSGSAWRTSIAAGKAELHIDPVANPLLKVIVGDLFVALTRAGEPMFEVLRVDDRGETRLVVDLGEA